MGFDFDCHQGTTEKVKTVELFTTTPCERLLLVIVRMLGESEPVAGPLWFYLTINLISMSLYTEVLL